MDRPGSKACPAELLELSRLDEILLPFDTCLEASRNTKMDTHVLMCLEVSLAHRQIPRKWLKRAFETSFTSI
jgi:ferredoxin-like protein FixX